MTAVEHRRLAERIAHHLTLQVVRSGTVAPQQLSESGVGGHAPHTQPEAERHFAEIAQTVPSPSPVRIAFALLPASPLRAKPGFSPPDISDPHLFREEGHARNRSPQKSLRRPPARDIVNTSPRDNVLRLALRYPLRV